MVMVKVAEVVPDVFVAVTVTVETPAAVGVPLIAPVRGSSVRPAGSPVAV
jgi:hypothetical protein